MADIAYGLERLTGKDGGLLEVVEAIVSDDRLIITSTDEDVLQRRHGPLNIFYNAQVAERARMGDVLRESAAAARAGPRSALRSNSKRAAKLAEINALIAEILAMLTTEQLIERLDATGIANARMNTPEEVWEHRQLKARNRWLEMDSPAGPLATLLPPVTMPDYEARISAVPALGKRTERILGELGYSRGEIATLREAGVL